MTITSKNLGFIKAIHSDTIPPTNKKMLWYNENDDTHYYFDVNTNAWRKLKFSTNEPIEGIQFTTDDDLTYPLPNGYIRWNKKELTFEFGIKGSAIQINQEGNFAVSNTSGLTALNGRLFRLIGYDSERDVYTIGLSDCRYEQTAIVDGILTHDVEDEEIGLLVYKGRARGLDTSAATELANAYLGEDGLPTHIKPTYPSKVIQIGKFGRIHDTLGEIIMDVSASLQEKFNQIDTELSLKQDVLDFTPENIANKGQNSGYCGLDEGAKVPLQHLPNTLLTYKGVWNVETNTPTLTTPDETKKGFVYTIGVVGTRFGIDWKLGDWLIYNDEGVIEKSDNSDDVVSVNGKQGVVVLSFVDVGAIQQFTRTASNKVMCSGGDGNTIIESPVTIDDDGNVGVDGNIAVSGTVNGRDVAADGVKLDGIEEGAEVNQTDSEIKTQYENNANTNAFTDSEKSKLASLESSKFLGTYTSESALTTTHPSPAEGSYAHVDSGVGDKVNLYIWDMSDSEWQDKGESGDETAATIKSKYESNADTNAYTDDEKTKLAGIQHGAEVNVNADWDSVSGDSEILNKPSDVTDLSLHTSSDLSDGSNLVKNTGTSTDNALTRFDGTTGKVIQNSIGKIDDDGNLSEIKDTSTETVTIDSAVQMSYDSVNQSLKFNFL